MAIGYCHRHDRKFDLDWDTECPECVEDVVVKEAPVQPSGTEKYYYAFLEDEPEIGSGIGTSKEKAENELYQLLFLKIWE
jgi:hypothetical protein